jgi:hypothetical protein
MILLKSLLLSKMSHNIGYVYSNPTLSFLNKYHINKFRGPSNLVEMIDFQRHFRLEIQSRKCLRKSNINKNKVPGEPVTGTCMCTQAVCSINGKVYNTYNILIVRNKCMCMCSMLTVFCYVSYQAWAENNLYYVMDGFP